MLTAHTDLTLTQLMHDELLVTATQLGWDVTSLAYRTALRRVLRRLGLTSADAATNVSQLEAVAIIEAWRSVVNQTVLAIDYDADGGRFAQEAIHKHAVSMVARLEADYAAHVAVVDSSPTSTTLDTYARW